MSTDTAQVKTWYLLDKINSYTTNTVLLVNKNNLTLRINMTLSLLMPLMFTDIAS